MQVTDDSKVCDGEDRGLYADELPDLRRERRCILPQDWRAKEEEEDKNTVCPSYIATFGSIEKTGGRSGWRYIKFHCTFRGLL